jgi:hypothetical protein
MPERSSKFKKGDVVELLEENWGYPAGARFELEQDDGTDMLLWRPYGGSGGLWIHDDYLKLVPRTSSAPLTAPDGNLYTVNWETRRLEPVAPPAPPKSTPTVYRRGHIYQSDKHPGDTYVLAASGRFGDSSVLICVEDGKFWNANKTVDDGSTSAELDRVGFKEVAPSIETFYEAAFRAKYGPQIGDHVKTKEEASNTCLGVVTDLDNGKVYSVAVRRASTSWSEWFNPSDLEVTAYGGGLSSRKTEE